MGNQIAIVYVDDWQGLYVNEDLVYQDHQITVQRLMEHVLHKSVDRFDYIEASDTHMAMTGAFSDRLRDVVLPTGHTVQEYWETQQ
jgi:hypothetical protein